MPGFGSRLAGRDYDTDAATLARRLLGCLLVRVLDDGTRLSGVIVETEAYLGAPDRASHAFGGRRTARNEAMYGRPGTCYVYFTYGMHFMCNVVCGRRDEPLAVLLRALEPAQGVEVMRRHRARRPRARPLGDTDLCSGPGKLCQALAIDRRLNGLDLTTGVDLFIQRSVCPPVDGQLANTPRIGVDSAGEWARKPLRWFLAASPHVSVAGPRIRAR